MTGVAAVTKATRVVRALIPAVLAGAAVVAGPGTAAAGTRSTPVSGTFNEAQENACIHISIFFYLADCSYARVRAEVGSQSLPWVGPTVNPVYYPPESPHADPAYRPVPGDDRIRPALTGTLTIDDRGTPAPGDDLISGELIVGPAARNVVSGFQRSEPKPPRTVHGWSRIVHTLAPTAVDSATATPGGGVEYIIASRGFPARLCRREDPADCFPSAHAPRTTDGPNGEGTWAGPPDGPGIERDTIWGTGNIGAVTTAIMEGRTCRDDVGGRECDVANVVWGAGEDPGLDNLLLKVITGPDGRVVRAEGFWTNEYFIRGGPDSFQVPEGHNNSWQGGFLEVRGAKP